MERIDYGDEPSQHLELSRPDGPGPWPVAVLLHGGFWRIAYGLELMRPMVGGLVERGFAVANVEYRRVGCRAPRGGDAAQALLGGEPSEVGTRYEIASPMELVPIGVPVVLVHGTADDRVPIGQSEDYDEVASAAGDVVELIIVEGADHFSVIDPTSELWKRALVAIERLI